VDELSWVKGQDAAKRNNMKELVEGEKAMAQKKRVGGTGRRGLRPREKNG